MELQSDALKEGDRCIIVDDLIATVIKLILNFRAVQLMLLLI